MLKTTRSTLLFTSLFVATTLQAEELPRPSPCLLYTSDAADE